MTVQISGTLKTWNAERGFGFVTPSLGGPDVFIHISDYPRGRAPQIGDALLFEIGINQEGKKKAIKVQRSDTGRPTMPLNSPTARPDSNEKSSLLLQIALIGGLFAMGFAGFQAIAPRFQTTKRDTSTLSTTPSYRCDGRRYCQQMTSCEEAKYFLKNCPNTEMDGDGDGIPCEKQHCTGFFGN